MEQQQQQEQPMSAADDDAPVVHDHDDDMMMTEAADHVDEEGDDQDVMDGTPLFLNPEDAVEVQVDDDNVPMDEDDDDDDDDDDADFENDMEAAAAAALQERNQNVVDMSNLTLASHSGHVYAVESFYDASTRQLLVVSGGGDDRAFLHHISPTTTAKAVPAPPAPPAVVVQPTTLALDYAHKDSVSCVALNLPFLPTDSSSTDAKKFPRILAVGSYDGAIVLYNPDTGAPLSLSQTTSNNGNGEASLPSSSAVVLEGPTDVECLAFHPKGGSVLLAGSAADGTLWMYHIPMRKCLQVFVGHESAVTSCSFTPDGKWALSASADGTVRVWAPRTGLCKHVFRVNTSSSTESGGGHGNSGGPGLTCMAVNGGSDGQLIVVGAEDGQAHFCHVGSKKIVASLRHYEVPPPPSAAAKTANPDDDDDELDDDELEDEEEENLPMSVEAVGFASPAVNPNWCATGGVDGVLKIWDLANNAQCRQVCHPPTTSSATTQPQAPGGGGVETNATATTTAKTTTTKNNDFNKPGGITRLQWHPSLPVVFTADTVGIIRIWDARNGKLLQSLTGHKDVINDMNVTFMKNDENGMAATTTTAAEDAVIVSASDDQTVRLFHVNVTALLQPQQHQATAPLVTPAVAP